MCAAGKGSIDTGDNACTSLCCDRYLDTFNEVRKKNKSNSNSEEYYRLYSIVKYTWALTFENFCQVRKTLQSRNRR